MDKHCWQFFIITIEISDSRCDGYEDCFDQSDEIGCEDLDATNTTLQYDDFNVNGLYGDEYPT